MRWQWCVLLSSLISQSESLEHQLQINRINWRVCCLVWNSSCSSFVRTFYSKIGPSLLPFFIAMLSHARLHVGLLYSVYSATWWTGLHDYGQTIVWKLWFTKPVKENWKIRNMCHDCSWRLRYAVHSGRAICLANVSLFMAVAEAENSKMRFQFLIL